MDLFKVMLLCCSATTFVFGRQLNVPTTRGWLKGKMLTTSGHRVEAYFGIPYAQAQRFKKPWPHARWWGIRSATQLGASCPQDQTVLKSNWLTDENCLFLNVLTPVYHRDIAYRLPVLFLIHGGAFELGSSSMFPHQQLAEKLIVREPMVIVTINYRLGPLGFMVGHVNGKARKDFTNLGILDQIEALRWVQREIGNFGGDTRRVTVYGSSAGSISASMLTLISDADRLFDKVFMQSNSFLAPIHQIREGNEDFGVMKSSKVVAKTVGCQAWDDTLECMRTKTVDALMKAAKIDLVLSVIGLILTFVYCHGVLFANLFVEFSKHQQSIKNNERGQQILPGTRWHPIVGKNWMTKRLAARPRRTMVLGLNRDEWSLFMLGHLFRRLPGSRSYFQNQLRLVAESYVCESRLNDLNRLLSDKLEPAYDKDTYKGRKTSEYWLKLANNAATDGFSAAALWLDAEASRKQGYNTYLFEIEHVPHIYPRLRSWQPWVPHSYDFGFLLGQPGGSPILKYKATARDLKAANHYIQLLVNFVASGNPTPHYDHNRPKWLPLRLNIATNQVSSNYYSIQENPRMKDNFRSIAVKQWAPLMRCEQKKNKPRSKCSQFVNNLCLRYRAYFDQLCSSCL